MSNSEVLRPGQPAKGTYKKTPEALKAIMDALALGMTRKDACILAGISQDSFARWLKDDTDFADAVLKAGLAAKKRALTLVHKAALTSWQAGAWYLERRYRDEFALRHELSGVDGEPIESRMLGADERKMIDQAIDYALPGHQDRADDAPAGDGAGGESVTTDTDTAGSPDTEKVGGNGPSVSENADPQ